MVEKGALQSVLRKVMRRAFSEMFREDTWIH